MSIDVYIFIIQLYLTMSLSFVRVIRYNYNYPSMTAYEGFKNRYYVTNTIDKWKHIYEKYHLGVKNLKFSSSRYMPLVVC